MTRERIAGAGEIALVEDEIDDLQHCVQSLWQFGQRRNLIRNVRVADLRLGPDDALRQRSRSGEECVRNLLRRQPADLAQGECDLRVMRNRGVTAGEDQAKPIVGHIVHIAPVVALGMQLRCHIGGGGIKTRHATLRIDGTKARGGNQPCARIRRNAVTRPSIQTHAERIVQRLLGEIEITEEADQRGQYPTRFSAVQCIDLRPDVVFVNLVHGVAGTSS